MGKYITYDIETLEDVKLAHTNNQIDSEETLEYISGSSIRGAFIYKYITEYGIKDINQGIHKEKLLKGGIKFLNAYPEYHEERSIPFPKVYFASKEDIKAYELSQDTLNLKLGLDNILPSDYERVRNVKFVGYDDNHFYRVDVNKIVNLHINKSNQKNMLFRYEAIKRGQKFKGIIKVEDESYIDEIINLFNDTDIYVGGSKGTGYGRCRINNMEVLEENPEYLLFEDKDYFEDHIYLIALSDIIYRNEYGQYKTKIEEEYLCKKLGLESVKYKDSIIETKNITNFNNKWNCRTPQVVGIKAGSVFKYGITGEIDEEKLFNFIDEGIGERKEDGFGRFVIVDSLREDDYIFNENDFRDNEAFYNLYKKLNEDEINQLQDIINRIYMTNVEKYIGRVVLEKSKDIKYSRSISQRQWGNFKDLFSYMKTLKPEEGKKKYKDLISNIKNKRSVSYKWINKVKYKGDSIEKLFDDLVNNSTDLDYFNNVLFKDVKIIRIGDNLTSKIDKYFSYTTTMNLLIELIKFQIKGRIGREGNE